MQSLPENFTYKRTVVLLTATILAGQTTSSTIDCGGMQLLAMKVPSNWTTANVSFNASYYPTSDFGLVNITDGSILGPILINAVSASDAISLVPYWFAPYPYLQVVSSNPQSTKSVIELFMQPIFQGVHG